MSELSPTWETTESFGQSWPIPFRVLWLSFMTLVGFATNLHLLAFLGIDTSLVLDIRLDSGVGAPVSHLPRAAAPFVHPSRLYPPLYSLAALGLAWTATGWSVFMKLTGGDPIEMVRWRGVPAFVALMVGAVSIAPVNIMYRKQRFMFLRALKRIIFSPLYSPVPFCDIILADILTSSAKVLGDVWVSGCLLFTTTKQFGIGGLEELDDACARVLMVPIMTSLPYIFRFRQCISEVVTGSTPTPRRSMLNALKYATAFPVIFFSAMQSVIGDPFDEEEVEKEANAWIARSTLFYLWVLAVLVNSLYSFWWDVTNDWGLSLLTPAGWSASPTVSYAFINTPQNLANRHSLSAPSGRAAHPHARVRSQHAPGPAAASLVVPTVEAPPPSRPHSPTLGLGTSSPSKAPHAHLRGQHSRAFSTAQTPNVTYPFLRPILLLPDPLIYYLAIALDLILRFTWSLKLSSHLHSIHENEGGIFLMEALEVVRRWMWVYLRIEWEAVRKGGGGFMMEKSDGESRIRAEEEGIEMARREAGGYQDEEPPVDSEIGLGIQVAIPRDVKG